MSTAAAARSRPADAAATSGRCAATDSANTSVWSAAITRRNRGYGRRAPCCRPIRRRPRCSPSTTARPWACWTPWCRPASTSGRRVGRGLRRQPAVRLAHIDLTTVSQNSQQLAEHAVTAVIERLDGGRTEHREVVVAPRLVVRGTTAPVPDLTTPG